MPNLIMRARLALALMLAVVVATGAQAQARDTVVIVSVGPAGNLRWGTPTEFVIVADVTLASLDTGAVAMGFNLDDPRRYRMFASLAIHRGTQRVTLRATVPPVNWSEQGARFAYIVNIRPLDMPSADGRSRALATIRGEFGTIRPEYGTVRDVAAQQSTGEQTYFEFQVEKPVRQAPGSAVPRYPPELKATGVEGEVVVQFVVDTLGAPALTTFRVLKSSHGEFTEAVKAALPGMTFVPAELRGRKVRQLVQQPFVFAIQKKDSSAATGGVLRAVGQPPAIPVASITPAPRTGTVRGWMIVGLLTMDSGNGSAALSFVTRRYGAAGRTRTEMEPPVGLRPLPLVATLRDSSTGRTTVLMASRKSANVMNTQGRDLVPMTSRFRPSPNGIKDLGAGEMIAGLPTRHYRVTGTTTSRFNLGTEVCVVTQETVTEYWTTTDPTFISIQRKARALATAVREPSPMPLPEADASDLSALGPFLRVVAHNAGPVRHVNGAMTVTSEVLSFSDSTLDASLFEVPEGYELRDLTSVVPPVRRDSMRADMTRRLFEQWVDTTKVVPGVTTKCTALPARP